MAARVAGSGCAPAPDAGTGTGSCRCDRGCTPCIGRGRQGLAQSRGAGPDCGARCLACLEGCCHAPVHAEVAGMSMALATAAEVTGLVQQALEKLHTLTTYELSSSAVTRHAALFASIRARLTLTR